VQGFYLLFLLFLAFYQFAISLKTTACMLFLLFQQALLIFDNSHEWRSHLEAITYFHSVTHLFGKFRLPALI
jgi:hypothetical protein